MFRWPGAADDGFVPAHMPDPSAYDDHDIGVTPDRTAVCRYRDYNSSKGRWGPRCLSLADPAGPEVLPGAIAVEALVRVPRGTARLVDPQHDGPVSAAPTGVVVPNGDEVWEIISDGWTGSRTMYLALDASGAQLGCLDADNASC